MVEILVRAENTGSVLNGHYGKGFGVVVIANPTHWGGEECPPKFVRVRVTDTDSVAAVAKAVEPWMRKTTYEILNHDPATDFFRVRIYTEAGGASEVTKALMDEFLVKWGAETVSDAEPGVMFEITAMDAVNGTGLFSFGDEDEFMNYTETAYDAATGVHSIHCDYSLSSVKKADLERVLTEAGFYDIVTDHEKGICDFKGDRATMIQQLERAVENRFNTMMTRVRYRFTDAIVNEALVTGTYELTLSDLDDALTDVAEEV